MSTTAPASSAAFTIDPANNRYKADLRDFSFLLVEQFKLGEILGKGFYEAWGEDECKSVLQQGYRLAREVLGPLSASADAQGCRLEDGRVKTPSGFKEAWDKTYEAGIKLLAADAQIGGLEAPYSVWMLVEEMQCGANTAFTMYPGLAHGAAEVI